MNQCRKENSAMSKSHSAHTVPLTKCVGIWIRVSTEDQAKGESPEHHLERAKAYAQARGWTVKEIYDLAGVSGKSVKDHPEAKRMLKDIERGHITGLIFSKLARLARNTKELLEFSDFFREHEADLVSVAETIDTSTPSGRLFFTIIAAMAQWEREEIADRVRASVITRAKLGKSINGRAPYGYEWRDKRLVPHPEEAPIRRKAYALFLQYRRKGTVARLLNEAGYRTREGVPWRDMQVTRVLVESSAKGVYFFNRGRKHGAWRSAEKPESEWGQVACDPIVSETLWTQVNQIIEEQLKSWKRPGKLPVHTFSNVASCACGHKMYVRKGSSKYVCRKCHNKVPVEDIEEVFHSELKDFFASPERIASHFQSIHQNLAEKDAALTAHEREIAKVKEEMTRTHRLYLDGHITGAGFGEFYKPAEERLNQLLAQLPKLQAEVDCLKVNTLSADEVLAEATKLYDRWPTLPTDEKRKIVESIVERITIGESEIDISLSYLPTSEELCKSQQQLRGPG
jgi:site-specific DNA recombinase